MENDDARPAPSRRAVPALLIAAGGLLLAMNFGLVRPDIWVDIMTLWPVLLIGLGLSIMFGGSRAGEFAAAAATLAMLAIGALWLRRQSTSTSNRARPSTRPSTACATRTLSWRRAPPRSSCARCPAVIPALHPRHGQLRPRPSAEPSFG
ncbi:MAG: DUF5668 domain-containing protein [Anaerolineae bacterium]